MRDIRQKTYYRRRLPHYQPEDATFFVTFRLHGSLPAEVMHKLVQEKESAEKFLASSTSGTRNRGRFEDHRQAYFERFEALLDSGSSGPHWLRDDHIASIVAEAIHYRDKKQYDLLAFCIMPNHVHMVVTVERRDSSLYRTKKHPYALASILQDLKWYTALQCNRALGRKGAFWQHESYDHVVRNSEELERILRYVTQNPVNAAMVDSWKQWKWSYLKPELEE